MTGALNRIDVAGARDADLRSAWSEGPSTYLGMLIPGLPNLIALNGPGSPSVLANMVATSEQQVDWSIALILQCVSCNADSFEPRQDAAHKWNQHVNEVANHTLFPMAKSWYTGENVPGKHRQFMPYIGGFGTYRSACDDARDNGYEGLIFTWSGAGLSRFTP